MSQCQKAGRETCQPDLTLAPTSPGRQVKSKLCTLTVRDIALDMRGLSSHNPKVIPWLTDFCVIILVNVNVLIGVGIMQQALAACLR
jgi:hypothetical protein